MVSPYGVSVAVDVDERQVDLMLASIESTLTGHNLFLFLRDYMQPYMRQRAKERFRNEGDDASGAWAALTEVTNDIRDHLGFPREHPINRRTGDLENFMLRGVIDYSQQLDAASMFYPGNPPGRDLKEKLKTAQTGKTRPSTPPRPVAAVSSVDMIYFLNSFVFWFGREVQQRVGGIIP